MATTRADELTDGYHTMRELYDYRAAYNALLFNEWAATGKYGLKSSPRLKAGDSCL